jgi:hypothetical protein
MMCNPSGGCLAGGAGYGDDLEAHSPAVLSGEVTQSLYRIVNFEDTAVGRTVVPSVTLDHSTGRPFGEGIFEKTVAIKFLARHGKETISRFYRARINAHAGNKAFGILGRGGANDLGQLFDCEFFH